MKNTRESVSSHFQTRRSSSGILYCMSYFQLGVWKCDETLFRVLDIYHFLLIAFLRLFLRMQNGSLGMCGELKRWILPSVDQM